MKQLRELSRIAVAVAIGGLVLWGAITWHRWQLGRVRAALATVALRADSLAAVADTTRLLRIEQLGDSLQAYQRRVVQEAQKADRLDRALGQERIARLGLQAQLAALDTSVTGDSTTEQLGVRSGRFDIRQPPYTVAAEVALPAPPAAGTLGLRIQLDPIPLHLRLGCQPANAIGIRPAQVTAVAPRWATIALDSITQSPDLCRSPALVKRPRSRILPLLLGIVGGVVGWELIR